MIPLDAVDVADALDGLSDVPEWRLPASDWDDIAEVLQAMTDARAPEDFAEATADLELASPRRYTPLGSTPLVGPPPRVTLLRDRLFRTLSDLDLPPAPELPPRPDATTEGLLTHYLVVHVFASATDAAYPRLRRLWDGCGAVFGTNQPIDELHLPIALPAAIPTGTTIAARRSDHVQAIVRREHDTLVLSVAAKAPGVTWAQLASRWQQVAARGEDGPLIGVVTIFAGTVETSPDLAIGAVVGALPATVDDFWRAESNEIGPCTLWELPPFVDGRRRRLVTLAGPGREPELSALIWSRGDAELAPLTRYLLSAAKGHYERRVLDETALELTDPSWIEALSDAAAIAGENMAQSLVAAGGPADPRTGPLSADFRAVTTMQRQIDLDRRHTARSRAHAATYDGQPTIGLVTALPQEFAAMSALLDNPADKPIKGDRAMYRLGTLPSADPNRPHEVVLTLLAETGNDAAAYGGAHLVRSFPSVDHLVMVGIAAGVPRTADPARHVRLGDIVVAGWDIVDFDHIVDRPGGPERRQDFPRRSDLLAGRVKLLVSGEILGCTPWDAHLDRLIEKHSVFSRPAADTDVVYSGDDDFAEPVPHPDLELSGHRPGRPKVHEGQIGSSDRSMRNASARDEFARQHNLVAIEMEGKGIGRAGHADGRDWFVVRGISDYGDRWTNNVWRPYASAAAAAYVRALLEVCPPLDPHGGHTGGARP
uniref:CATRA conflict system CASPASE/TPR repeat-associated protein n=1 Tax=Paractinoplanes polyasparticus TaxID=2856853 RepID=UPI001C85342D|nr:CATRA conflict system CASPASE/TPR repeat-associated protein [Actinoplanes polyasparticus]